MQISEAIQQARDALSQAGLKDSPKLDAELLLAHALQTNRTFLFTWPERVIPDATYQAFQDSLNRRQQGEPIAYILGYQEFWGLEFHVNEHTLIPRPDTEILVEEALSKAKNHQGWCQDSRPPLAFMPFRVVFKVLDLGTGSGAIICAFKHDFPDCEATAVDFSAPALAMAQKNAEHLGLDIEFLESNWFSGVKDRRFSLIISNPPYIEEDDSHLSEGDVRFEPSSALTSGTSGLEDISLIIKQAKNHLETNGWLLIEHGYNQAEAVQAIFKAEGYQAIETKVDYGNNPRITFGQFVN